MKKKESYESRVEAFLLPLMEENNFELVDVEYVKEAGTWYLRAYIDKEGGIAVDDCEVISRRLSDWLDKEDFIDDSYILEVSSPGLGRPLKKEKDYKRSIGREVEVRLYKAIDRQKEFTGTLSAYDDKTVTLAMEDGSEAVFEKADIALIRLAAAPEFHQHTHRVRLRNLGTTDKKSPRKIRYRKTPREHTENMIGG